MNYGGLIWLAEQFAARLSDCANGSHFEQIEVPCTHPAAISVWKKLISSEQVCQPMGCQNGPVSGGGRHFHYLWGEEEKLFLSYLGSFFGPKRNTGFLGKQNNSWSLAFKIFWLEKPLVWFALLAGPLKLNGLTWAERDSQACRAGYSH